MSELPRGWVEATLGEIAQFVMGQAPPGAASNFDGVGTPFVKAGEFGELRPIIREWTTQPLKYAMREDILICVVGATAGKINLGEDCAIGRSVAAIRPVESASQHFLYNFLKTKVLKLREGSVGSAQGVISKDDLSDLALPLPPLAEQKRIVAKLDALNAKSARARTEVARLETLVSRYKQAVLSKAFSGELTSPGEDGERPKVSRSRLSEVCLSLTDGDHQAPPKAPSGVPFITISAMNDGQIEFSKATRFVPESYYRQLQSSRKAEAGDILYSVTGSYGIPAIVESDRPFVFQRHIAILKVDRTIVSPQYLKLLLGSPELRVQADTIATGTAQKTVSLKGLRNFEIPVPSLEKQDEIVRRIESAFGKMDRLAKEAKRALELVGRLDEAILAKAFRGELVPQDDNDEPAEHLLERIRAERATAPNAKRGSKRA